MDHDEKMTILSYLLFFLSAISYEMKNGESADWIPRLKLYLFM